MEYSRFQISQPQLLEVTYIINEDFNNSDNADNIKLEANSVTRVEMLTDDTGAKVIFTLKIFDQEKLSEVPFFMQVSMKGFFRWDESMDEEIYKKLLRTNAPAILLSYIRPFVSQLTSASGYPPLILPLIDFSSNEILEIT